MKIDEWLADRYGYSRSYASNLLKNGFITVNKIVVKRRQYEVQDHDVINVNLTFPTGRIVYQNDHLIIVHKPCGMSVERSHSTPKWHKVLAEDICEQLNLPVVHAIHRLDKDTEGLVCMITNKKYLDHYKEQMTNKKFIKVYVAFNEPCDYVMQNLNVFTCAHGKKVVCYDRDICLCDYETAYEKTRIFIQENKNDIRLTDVGKECITYVKKIDYGYECALYTGRTHQIRLWMLSNNTPIIGDVIYGKKHEKPLQLFANYISFEEIKSSLDEFEKNML